MFFTDLKVAFDRMDRKKLWKKLRETGINEELVKRVEKLYRETSCRVKIGEKRTEKFWTERRLR